MIADSELELQLDSSSGAEAFCCIFVVMVITQSRLFGGLYLIYTSEVVRGYALRSGVGSWKRQGTQIRASSRWRLDGVFNAHEN
jgi:hypothetical protein